MCIFFLDGGGNKSFFQDIKGRNVSFKIIIYRDKNEISRFWCAENEIYKNFSEVLKRMKNNK